MANTRAARIHYRPLYTQSVVCACIRFKHIINPCDHNTKSSCAFARTYVNIKNKTKKYRLADVDTAAHRCARVRFVGHVINHTVLLYQATSV